MIDTQTSTELFRLSPERIRRATPGDISALYELADVAMRGPSGSSYSQRQIASALLYLTQIDPRLITDGTYFVADAGGHIVGGAGWTRRTTARHAVRHEQAANFKQWLDTSGAAAKIGAVYVDPGWARRGIGRRLVSMCERAARHAGYNELALLTGLGGVALYRACGYRQHGQFDMVLPDATMVPLVAMSKFMDSRDR